MPPKGWKYPNGIKKQFTDLERLSTKYKVNEETGCWEWTASRDSSGYGQFSYKGSMKGAHKVSYILHVGEVKKGLHVCHHCDNPCCINPSHLFLGTPRENGEDMYNKGRRQRMKCPSYVMWAIGKCRCEGCVQAYRDYRKTLDKEKLKAHDRKKYLKNRERYLEYARQQRLKAKEAMLLESADVLIGMGINNLGSI